MHYCLPSICDSNSPFSVLKSTVFAYFGLFDHKTSSFQGANVNMKVSLGHYLEHMRKIENAFGRLQNCRPKGDADLTPF